MKFGPKTFSRPLLLRPMDAALRYKPVSNFDAKAGICRLVGFVMAAPFVMLAQF